MENASKALIIAGAILLCILIIAIGMYIYTQAEGNIRSSVESMSTQEVDAFNSEWTVYDGQTNGSAVKAMLSRLVANLSTYSTEPEKVPSVSYYSTSTATTVTNTANFSEVDEESDSDADQTYADNISAIRASIDNKHTYTVKCNYNGKTGLINNIEIRY